MIMYIKQKSPGPCITIVEVLDDDMPLEEHEAVVERPNLFEIIDEDKPESYQQLRLRKISPLS